MKAVIWSKYGPAELLKLKDVPKPSPKDNEVLIRIRAATVTAGDCELRRFDIQPWIWLPVRLIMGIFSPRKPTLGQEFSGEVEAVGKNVTKFQPGDKVFGPSGMSMGAYAEYKCVSSGSTITHNPANMTFEEAATVPTGGLNALHFLKKAQIVPGQKVLIVGAGGSIGTYGVQLAKSMGAEVTCIDSAKKLDMLQTIGADHVIDYQKADFTKNGQKYDVIFDIVCRSSFSEGLKSLTDQGYYLIGNPSFTHMMQALWASRTTSKRALFALAGESVEDLNTLKELIEEGKLRSVIDRRFPLSDIVEAHKYVEAGLKAGNVVITV